MYVEAVFAIFIVICISFVWRQTCKPENFPPGPAWLPVIGNFLDIRKLMNQEKYQHKAFSVLFERYRSSIIGLKVGQSVIVIVSGKKLVHDVLTKEEFEGRPDNFFIRLRSMGTRKGVTCTDGLLWHDQRAFVLRHLRNLGYGKKNMENIIHDELIQLRSQLAVNGQKIRMGPLFAKAVLNTLWTLVAGCRLSSSEFLDKMLQLMEERTRLFDISGGLLNHFPWLRFLLPSTSGYKLILDINKKMKTLFQDVIAEHKLRYDSAETKDLIDAFLHQMNYLEKKNCNNFYTDDQLMMICLDLFIAGSQTTSNSLDFAILLMALNQDIQKKVQNEIRSIIGEDHLPSNDDRLKMPYVEAVINEILRFCHVTPIAGPRRTLRNAELDGYSLPKDTSILIDIHSVHMDREYWGDPWSFRPDRFLNADGKLRTVECFIPFGLGRRRCLGETLARSFIFIFFTGILQHYHIQPANGEKLDITPIPGITLAPKQYHIDLFPMRSTDC